MKSSALIRVLGLGLLLGIPGASRAPAQTAPAQTAAAQTADAIYYNATVVTMDDAAPSAQAVAVAGTKILAVGSNEAILKLKGSTTKVVDLEGKTLVPGFIDAHSHLAGYGYFNDPANWVDVSSVNMFFKPLPGTPGCKSPTDYQACFIPVRSQDDVIGRLKTALVNASATNAPAVMAFNYDPARLGPGKGCSGAGFACPNFENGTARQTLDALSTTVPIYVESESGHVAYVNTPALKMLKICGADSTEAGCYMPTTNPEVEIKLARKGQLDEDLTFYATGLFQGLIFKKDKLSALAGIRRAAKMYAARGFTLTQEGAANGGLITVYDLVTREPDFPTTAAMVVYDAASSDFQKTIDMANSAKTKISGNPRLFVAAVKSFADGSPQAYTAFVGTPFLNLYPPFTLTDIFPKQPYVGLPDVDGTAMATRLVAAHKAGYPMLIHQNGAEAIAQTVAALQQAQQTFPSPNLRDIVLHAPAITEPQMDAVKALKNATVSFLMGNVYYWGQPLCQQVLGPPRTLNIYPAGYAERTAMRMTLHHDTPVTPPDPLFAMWVAKTRRTQQAPWYPRATPACPEAIGLGSAISIRTGLKAYTTDAAWQYGLDATLGSITAGKTADLAILSDNPLRFESQPHGLLTIKVLATVSQGRHLDHADAPSPQRATSSPE